MVLKHIFLIFLINLIAHPSYVRIILLREQKKILIKKKCKILIQSRVIIVYKNIGCVHLVKKWLSFSNLKFNEKIQIPTTIAVLTVKTNIVDLIICKFWLQVLKVRRIRKSFARISKNDGISNNSTCCWCSS